MEANVKENIREIINSVSEINNITSRIRRGLEHLKENPNLDKEAVLRAVETWIFLLKQTEEEGEYYESIVNSAREIKKSL